MADNRYISLKVCGNPEASSGFMPLILFNSPSIEIIDAFYTGFDSNSYFFSVKVEKTQVVYKLMKNNVRSYNSIRTGSLVIAFSIPRGYKLELGYDPYDVIIALKNKFLATYMTCRDKVNDTWEFNAGAIDPSPLEETARQFTLTPGSTPYHAMSDGAPVGYITCPEDKIEMLLKDIQCRNFSRFSEVVIAESATSTTKYTPITGLQIPRVPEYTIIVDGEYQGITSEKQKMITIEPKASPRFYDVQNLTFSIEQLENGDFIENVTLDGETETVYVKTAHLVRPKTKRIKLHFLNAGQQKYFFMNKNACRLLHQGRPILLNDNFEFTLTGDELAILDNPTGFKFECSKTDQYLISGTEYRQDGDQITVKAEVAPKPKDMMPLTTVVSPRQDVTDICFRFDNVDFFVGAEKLYVWVHKQDSSEPQHVKTLMELKRQSVKGRSNPEYVGHVYLPSAWNSYNMCARLTTLDRKKVFETSHHIQVKNNVAELGIKDLYEVKVSSVKHFLKSNRLLCMIVGALLCLLLGGVGGYLLHDLIPMDGRAGKRVDTEVKKGETGEKPAVEAEEVKDDNNQPKEPAAPITDDEAKANIEVFKATLSNQALTFAEVDDIYKQYQAHADQYQKLDKKSAEMIDRYKNVTDYIKQGDVKKLKEYCDSGKDSQLYYKHHLMVYEAFIGSRDSKGKTQAYSKDNRKKAEEYFMTHYSGYTAFQDMGIPQGLFNLQSNSDGKPKNPSQPKPNEPKDAEGER